MSFDVSSLWRVKYSELLKRTLEVSNIFENTDKNLHLGLFLFPDML